MATSACYRCSSHPDMSCMQVGLGVKPAVCRATCRAWHAACAQDFFTHDPRTGALIPCPAGGPGPGAAPCSRVRDMAADGEELCHLAGGWVGGLSREGGVQGRCEGGWWQEMGVQQQALATQV
jgi:hypothetical protein